jgi:hypothetical protein
MMKQIFMMVFLVLALFSNGAHAERYANNDAATVVSNNFKNLSPVEQQRMLAELSKPSGQVADKNISAEDVERWALVGRSVGVAIGEMFKSLGMGLVGTIEQFSATTVGKVAIGILLWKLFGNQIEHYILAATLLFIIVPLWWTSVRRNCMSFSLKEDELFGRKYVTKHWRNNGDDGANALHILSGLVIFATLIITILTAS